MSELVRGLENENMVANEHADALELILLNLSHLPSNIAIETVKEKKGQMISHSNCNGYVKTDSC